MHKHCGELSATFLFHIYAFIFPLTPSSSLSLVWQNWCCRLTREMWTSCWDLWMITWRRPLWKKRRVFRIPTTTLRGPAPVSKRAHHSVRAPAVAKDIFSPSFFRVAVTCWPGGCLAGLNFCKLVKVHGIKCS